MTQFWQKRRSGGHGGLFLPSGMTTDKEKKTHCLVLIKPSWQPTTYLAVAADAETWWLVLPLALMWTTSGYEGRRRRPSSAFRSISGLFPRCQKVQQFEHADWFSSKESEEWEKVVLPAGSAKKKPTKKCSFNLFSSSSKSF